MRRFVHRALTTARPSCLVAAALLCRPASPAITVTSARESLTFEVIQCAEGRTESPELYLAGASDYPNLRYAVADSVSVERIDDGYYRLTDSVPQGNYFFQLRSSHCSNYLQAAVLAEHRRVLSIALEPIPGPGKFRVKLFDSENSVAGTLAVRPSVGWLVAANGATRVLDLQDGAYYIERVVPGKYSLRFELHGSLQSEITIDLSNISQAQLVNRDINASTFRKNIGTILARGTTLKDCSYCY
jgi:hypothetical protein